MSVRQKDLQDRITSLSHELELSAYLNKESAVQLECKCESRNSSRERSAPSCESRLAETEDRLEAAEQRLRMPKAL